MVVAFVHTKMIINKINLIVPDTVDLNKFPFNISWIENFQEIKLSKNIVFFISENGKGKSTLLEAVAANLGFCPGGGTKNFRFGAAEAQSDLHRYIRISRSSQLSSNSFFFRSETFYNFGKEVDRLDSEPASSRNVRDSYGGKSLHEISRGESVIALAVHKFKPNSLYILDEPESGLSLNSQIALMYIIAELATQGSQFLIATHSPFLMTLKNSEMFSLDNKEIERINFADTNHFFLAKRLLLDLDFVT